MHLSVARADARYRAYVFSGRVLRLHGRPEWERPSPPWINSKPAPSPIPDERAYGRPLLAPRCRPRAKPELRAEITRTIAAVKAFAADIHAAKIVGPGGRKLFPRARGAAQGTGGPRFENVLVIGIGGSALGPQFVSATR